MLFACLFVPHFPVQAALRCEPDQSQRNSAVAILDGPESLLRVWACNQEAELAGVEIGMTKVQAEQCPDLLLRKRIPAQESAAQSALIDCASGFSPLVESKGQGTVIFEITGTDRVFGSPKELAEEARRAAATLGFAVSVGIAQNPDTAVVAAKGSSGIVVIPAGKEAACLAPLPIEVLSPTMEQAEIFDSWGIHTCGGLALLPSVSLVERLGQAGLRLQKLARGEVRRTLVAVEPRRKFEEHLELEDSVEELESLAFLLNRLLNQIFARLTTRGFATNEIRIRLGLEIHTDRDLRRETPEQRSAVFERTLKFPVPIKDAKVLLKLLQLDLSAHSPGAPVKMVTIEAIPTKPRYTQAGLFVPHAPEPEKLEVTLARMRSIVGDSDDQGRGRVGSPHVCDSHKSDDFRVVPFTVESGNQNQSNLAIKTEVAFSRFRPPLRAKVQRKGRKPVSISFAHVSTPIICAAGPWSTSGLWWHETGKGSREQWDIAIRVEGGLGLYRIFCENDKWFVEGLYD
jgi:protein ImuB